MCLILLVAYDYFVIHVQRGNTGNTRDGFLHNTPKWKIILKKYPTQTILTSSISACTENDGAEIAYMYLSGHRNT